MPDLKAVARQVLGAEAKLDGVEDDQLRRRVLGVLLPGLKIDGQTAAAYVEAAYQVATRDLPPPRPPSSDVPARERATGADPGTAAPADAFMRAAEDAWRRPQVGTTLDDP